MITQTVCVAVMNQLDRTKSEWGSLVNSISKLDETELILVDNACTDETGLWVLTWIAPKFKKYKHLFSRENRGVFRSYQDGFLNVDKNSRWIAYLHNDLTIYEHGWDERVCHVMDNYKPLGVCGFAGARGISKEGGRFEFWSNMLEAEIHGSRGYEVLPVAMLDGFSLICSTEMLKASGGWDVGYPEHHFYDMDICMTSRAYGFKNALIGVRCHHGSGQTASSGRYMEEMAKKYNVSAGKADLTVHQKSYRRFLEKWKPQLPVFVEDDFNVLHPAT